jgi:hypothetical protein
LHRVSLLRAVTNKDLSVEYRPAIAIENPFVQLMTVTVRLFVINNRVGVGMLITTDDIEAVDPTLGTFRNCYRYRVRLTSSLREMILCFLAAPDSVPNERHPLGQLQLQRL